MSSLSFADMFVWSLMVSNLIMMLDDVRALGAIHGVLPQGFENLYTACSHTVMYYAHCHSLLKDSHRQLPLQILDIAV